LTESGFTFKLACFNHIVLFLIELIFCLTWQNMDLVWLLNLLGNGFHLLWRFFQLNRTFGMNKWNIGLSNLWCLMTHAYTYCCLTPVTLDPFFYRIWKTIAPRFLYSGCSAS
jgi:hypothetical protein